MSGIYNCVKVLLKYLAVAACCLLAGVANAAHTQTSLILSATAVKPGDSIIAGIRLQMDPGWHTYWKNSGASGSPTKIEWQLPAGVTAGDILWPLPEKLPEGDNGDLTTYIYHDDVVLLVPLTFSSDLKPGTLELKAKISWLECEKICVPGKADVATALEIADTTQPSSEAALIKSWQNKVPQSAEGLSARASWEKAAEDDTRPLIIEWKPSSAVTDLDFFPYGYADFEVQAPTTILSATADNASLRKVVRKFEGDWPKEISGILIQKTDGKLQALETTIPIGGSELAATPALPAQSFGRMLLYAFIGGLILNIMPCVLPVIALKILGFVRQARENPVEVRKLGLIYTAGVLFSFLVLAGLVISVKAAGQKAGWGMQFGNPLFIVSLTVLVTLVALNLFGVFEVTLSGRVLDATGGLTSKHGRAGAFFNGILATALATPCTAPFLGVALGFAFAQTAAIIVLMFLFVGLGLALPYLILTWRPAWLSFLPKPGAWMEKLKIAMGFPMLATAVWLFTLTPTFYGGRVWWLGIFLVIVSLAAWIFGEFFQRGRNRRGLALGVALALVVVGYSYAIESQLRWRSPLPPDATASNLKESPDGIDWQRWSPQAVTDAREKGFPVLVDFTADWCLTCQVNKKTSIEVKSVREKLKEINAVALLGDYTRLPTAITDELNRFNRAGVPLVLVYPKDAGRPPMVLPEALTPGIVLDALDKAAM